MIDYSYNYLFIYLFSSLISYLSKKLLYKRLSIIYILIPLFFIKSSFDCNIYTISFFKFKLLPLSISEVESDLREYIVLENAIFVPISAKVGTNLNILREIIIKEVIAHQARENEKEKKKDEKMFEMDNKNIHSNIDDKIIDHNKNDNNENENRSVHHINSSSNGVLLDVIKSRKLGTTLHVVIRQGQVRMIINTFDFIFDIDCNSLFGSTLYCVLYCIVFYCIVLYFIVLYCIVLYCIVLYSTVLHCSMFFATYYIT